MIWTVVVVILVVSLLIGITGLYVAGEFATVSARKTRIVQMAEQGSSLAHLLLPVLEDPRRLDNFIAASQVGITLSSLVLGLYGQQEIAPLLVPLIARLPLGISPEGGEIAAAGVSATLVLLTLTTLAVIFGELLPKSVAVQYPERLALLTTLPMKWSADILLRPLIILLNGSGILILRLLGIRHRGEHAHIHSPEEIVILVKESHRGGLIDADEREMLRSVFRAREITAGEIAVPRTRITAADVTDPLEEVLRAAAQSAFTRIPIFDGDIDHIIGFVHLRDLFSLYRRDRNGDLRSILRQAPFVPESLPVVDVWDRLNETQSYLAFVFDEYGGTGGLITREDLLEELFGELQDEFDQEWALVTFLGDGHIIVRGDMQITHLNDLLEIDLPHQMSHTLGGLILDILGRVPRVGDTAEVGPVRLRVEAVAHMSAASVSVFLPPGVAIVPPEGGLD
jgi:CBS domain containing-hemolysin-like protein